MNVRVDTEALAPAMALSQADLVKLQTWFSPSFPIGGFSFSHGLEWVVETAAVRDRRTLATWIEEVLRHGAGRSDALLLSASWRAVHAGQWEEAGCIAAFAAALQPTAERRLESFSQGAAFLCASRAAWPHPLVERFLEHCPAAPTYPVAVGVTTAAHGLPLEAVLVACLHAFAANLVSAGIRLIPLGQTEGLQVLCALEGTLLDVAWETRTGSLEDLGSACFLADIASMRHETQYTRLFRS